MKELWGLEIADKLSGHARKRIGYLVGIGHMIDLNIATELVNQNGRKLRS